MSTLLDGLSDAAADILLLLFSGVASGTPGRDGLSGPIGGRLRRTDILRDLPDRCFEDLDAALAELMLLGLVVAFEAATFAVAPLDLTHVSIDLESPPPVLYRLTQTGRARAHAMMDRVLMAAP